MTLKGLNSVSGRYQINMHLSTNSSEYFSPRPFYITQCFSYPRTSFSSDSLATPPHLRPWSIPPLQVPWGLYCYPRIHCLVVDIPWWLRIGCCLSNLLSSQKPYLLAIGPKRFRQMFNIYRWMEFFDKKKCMMKIFISILTCRKKWMTTLSAFFLSSPTWTGVKWAIKVLNLEQYLSSVNCPICYTKQNIYF